MRVCGLCVRVATIVRPLRSAGSRSRPGRRANRRPPGGGANRRDRNESSRASAYFPVFGGWVKLSVWWCNLSVDGACSFSGFVAGSCVGWCSVGDCGGVGAGGDAGAGSGFVGCGFGGGDVGGGDVRVVWWVDAGGDPGFQADGGFVDGSVDAGGGSAGAASAGGGGGDCGEAAAVSAAAIAPCGCGIQRIRALRVAFLDRSPGGVPGDDRWCGGVGGRLRGGRAGGCRRRLRSRRGSGLRSRSPTVTQRCGSCA